MQNHIEIFAGEYYTTVYCNLLIHLFQKQITKFRRTVNAIPWPFLNAFEFAGWGAFG